MTRKIRIILSPDIEIEQILTLTPIQLRAAEYPIPYFQLVNFINIYQIAALIARIPAEQAVQLTSLELIINYFQHSSQEQLDEAIGRLVVSNTVDRSDVIHQRINIRHSDEPSDDLLLIQTRLIILREEQNNIHAMDNSPLLPTVANITITTQVEESQITLNYFGLLYQDKHL